MSERNYDNTIIPFYCKGRNLHSIVMSDQQFELIQIAVAACFPNKIQVIEKPTAEIDILRKGENE